MATASPPAEDLMFETKRIVTTHWRHFLALSVLFIVPLCSFTTVFYDIFNLIIIDHSAISLNNVTLLHKNQPPRTTAVADTKTVVLLLIAYIVVITVFHLLALGSITFSIYQGFHGKPVKLISSVKSSLASFLPLLATVISSTLIALGMLLLLGLATFLTTRLINFIFPDLDFDYFATSSYLLFFSILILIKLYRYWMLAWVIVVAESTWGLTPLKRSVNLIKGLTNKSLINEVRSNSLFIILIFVATHSNFILISRNVAASGEIYNNNNNKENGETETTLWIYVVLIVIMSAPLVLYNMASMAVSYILCKADHGEKTKAIVEEFEGEYVSLPFGDDGKVAPLV